MTVEPFTPEQTAAIRAVIDAEVERAVAAERAAFSEQLRELRDALEAGPGIGAWLRGLAKSWTAWTGVLLAGGPEILDALAPLVSEQWGPDVWKRVLQVSGVVMILLRLKTTQPVPEKGASS